MRLECFQLVKFNKLKGKGKGRLRVLQHCCLEEYCTLTQMSSFIHLQRRCTHQAAWERPLLAKEGTIPGIKLAIRNPRKLLGSLTCRKAGTWDRFFYLPSGGRHAEDFYARKIQRLRPGLNPQTWVPVASILITRPPQPSLISLNKNDLLL